MTPHICPRWCVNPVPHDRDHGGYFHDSDTQGVQTPAGWVLVKASQFVLDNHTSNTPLVQVSDERSTLLLLSPVEARQMAAALRATAARIDGVPDA